MKRTGRLQAGTAHVVAFLALFVALGGTGYAVSKLPKNSVGSPQVRDGSLGARDLAPDALRAGPRGPRGAQGPGGPQGATGAQGPAGRTNLRIADLGNDQVALSTTAWQDTTVLRIRNVPAGSYEVSLTGELGAGVVLSDPATVWCETVMLPVDQPNEAAATRVSIKAGAAGRVAGGSITQSISDFAVTTSAKPFDVWLRCHANVSLPSPFNMSHTRLGVAQIDDLTVVPH